MEPRKDALLGAKWTVGIVSAVVLGLVLALPLGLSMVALIPPCLVVVIAGWGYVAWRSHVVRRGYEPDARGGYTELVGGREAHEQPPSPPREARP